MKFGINCFGLKEALVNNFSETLKQLKEIGFDYIEPVVVFKTGLPMPIESAYSGLKAKNLDGRFWCENVFGDNYTAVKNIGMNIIGCQISGMLPVQGGVTAQINDMIDLGKKYGLKYFVYNPKKRGLENADALVQTIKTLKRELNANGFELYIHNHAEEFCNENGMCFFDYLMDAIPDLKVELDVGWVCKAGVDVLAVMQRYRDRIAILHLKDLYADNVNTFPAIGEGIIPLEDILNASKELNLDECGIIFDQDNSSNDIIFDTETGYNNIKNFFL